MTKDGMTEEGDGTVRGYTTERRRTGFGTIHIQTTNWLVLELDSSLGACSHFARQITILRNARPPVGGSRAN